MLTFPFGPEVVSRRIPFGSLCDLARTRGLTGFDMFLGEIKLYGTSRVQRGLGTNGLVLSSLIVTVAFLAEPQKIRAKIEKAIAMANRFRCKRIMIVPSDALTAKSKLEKLSAEQKLDHYVRGFSLAVDLAKVQGIEIMLEDTPTITSSLASAADCRALLDRVPGLRFVYDTGNMLVAGDDPIEFFHVVKDRISHVHLKDAVVVDKNVKGIGDITVDGRKMQPRRFGEGHVPLAEILQLLADSDYTGRVAIEYTRPEKGSSLARHSDQLDRFVTSGRAALPSGEANVPFISTPPFRWAYIGSGSIAKSTSRKILGTKRHEIATVFSRNPQKRTAFASRVRARPCATLEEAVLDPTVDAVYIASPANSHLDLARAAIDLGKPVLMEKPFTVDRAGAEELFALAHSRGVYLAEAMWTWFSPVARQVKAWLDDGELGEVQNARIKIGFPILPLISRLKDPNLVGGALLDLGIYATTYAVNLFGVPDRISASAEFKDGIDTGERITFHYDTGLSVQLTVSIVKWKGESVRITGSKGTITVPFFHAGSKATLRPTNGRARTFSGNGGYDNQFDLVAREIRAGRAESSYVPARSTIDNLGLLDEIRKHVGLRYPFELSTGSRA